MKKHHLLKGLFLAALLCAGAAQAQQSAQKPSFNQLQKAAIEAIVKEYLMQHPTLLQEAMDAQRVQDDSKTAQKTQQAIALNREALLHHPSSPVAGNAKGDVTIVEFFDYRCGYCKKVAPAVAALLEKDANVRIVYKDFPILGPDSVYGARAALAAQKQNKYMEFNHELMNAQTIDEGSVQAIAAKLGLDQKQFVSDMEDESIKKTLNETYTLANMLNIAGTPAFIVGDRLIPGATDVNGLMSYVTAEREKSRPLVK